MRAGGFWIVVAASGKLYRIGGESFRARIEFPNVSGLPCSR